MSCPELDSTFRAAPLKLRATLCATLYTEGDLLTPDNRRASKGKKKIKVALSYCTTGSLLFFFGSAVKDWVNFKMKWMSRESSSSPILTLRGNTKLATYKTREKYNRGNIDGETVLKNQQPYFFFSSLIRIMQQHFQQQNKEKKNAPERWLGKTVVV